MNEEYIFDKFFSFPKNMKMSLSVYPIKKQQLSFFAQAAKQISKQIIAETGIYSFKGYEFSFGGARRCKGEKYLKPVKDFVFTKVSEKEYVCEGEKTILKEFDEWLKPDYHMERDGYSYQRLHVSDPFACVIWIRWKSLCNPNEYIRPGTTQTLTEKDILFEICDSVPEEYLLKFYAKTAEEYNLYSWIDFFKTGKNFILNKQKKQINARCTIDLGNTGDGSVC